MKLAIEKAERAAFSARLRAALQLAGYSPSATAIAKEFNIRAGKENLTVAGVRKWLVGEAVPAQPKLVILADWLNVEAHWLRYGEGSASVLASVRDERSLTHTDQLILKDIRMLDSSQRDMARALVEHLLAVQ